MNTSVAQIDILPRHMSFPINEVKNPLFFDNNTLLSACVAALSATFPPGEAEFINSVRPYKDNIKDQTLLRKISGFIGQEGHHSHQHKQINAQLTALGFDAVRLEKHLAKDIKKFNNTAKGRNPKVRLALTVCMEHLTAIIADYLLLNPHTLDSMDSNMRDLLLWHAVEEIEHKDVAFDVYQTCVGNEALLHRTLKIGTFLFITRITCYLLAILWWAKKPPKLTDFVGFYRFMLGKGGLLRSLRKPYKEFFEPGFHPWDQDNRELISKWKENFYRKEYDKNESG